MTFWLFFLFISFLKSPQPIILANHKAIVFSMPDDTNDPDLEDRETSSNGSLRTVSTIDTTSAPTPAPIPAPIPAPTAKTTAPSLSPPLLTPAPAPSPVETEGVSNKSSTVAAAAAASSFHRKFHEARQSATAATITANVKAQQVKAATTAKFAAFRHSYGAPPPASASVSASAGPSPSSLTPDTDVGAVPPLSSRLNRITAAKTWQSWTTQPKPSSPSLRRPSMGNRWKSFTATVPIPTATNGDEDGDDGNVSGTPPTPAVVRDKWKQFTAGVKAKATNYTTNNNTISMTDGLQEPQQEQGDTVLLRPRLNDRLKSFTTTIKTTTTASLRRSSHVEGQEQDTDQDDSAAATGGAETTRWNTVTATLKTTVHDSLQEVRTDLAVLKHDSANFLHQAGTKLEGIKSTTSAKLAAMKIQVEQSRQTRRSNHHNGDGGSSSLFEGINFMPHHPTTTDDDDGVVNLQQAALVYRAPMQTLRAMGLATTTQTEQRCLELLHHTRGNVDRTVDMILADNNHEPSSRAPTTTATTTTTTTNLESSSTALASTATATTTTVAGTTTTDETSLIEESAVEISSSSDTPATASPTFVID